MRWSWKADSFKQRIWAGAHIFVLLSLKFELKLASLPLLLFCVLFWNVPFYHQTTSIHCHCNSTNLSNCKMGTKGKQLWKEDIINYHIKMEDQSYRSVVLDLCWSAIKIKGKPKLSFLTFELINNELDKNQHLDITKGCWISNEQRESIASSKCEFLADRFILIFDINFIKRISTWF